MMKPLKIIGNLDELELVIEVQKSTSYKVEQVPKNYHPDHEKNSKEDLDDYQYYQLFINVKSQGHDFSFFKDGVLLDLDQLNQEDCIEEISQYLEEFAVYEYIDEYIKKAVQTDGPQWKIDC